MTITPGHFRLTPCQRRFKALLNEVPELHPFWDWEQRNCRINELKQFMNVCSHGERIMASFFASIWLHDDTFVFSLIEAADVLDVKHRQIIVEWMSDPFFP